MPSGLQSIIDKFGPDAVGILGSARATNEENYVAQKFARVVIGSNNVDCCARVCHAPTAAGMKLMLGTGAATNSFDDIELARTILVCGANPRENHPIVGDRIVQAALRGAELIVIDPRRIELARYARLHLQPRPGTNIPLLNAMAHTIVEEGLYDPAAPDHVENWEAFQHFLADYSPEAVADVCGVDAELIRQAARLYATHKPAMCFHGLGVTEHVQGTEGVMCLVNLALITGNIGRPGAGVNPLRGQNNVQGAAHMGCDPGILTGSVPLAENRERFEAAWQAPIPSRPGLNLLKMMDAAERGPIQGPVGHRLRRWSDQSKRRKHAGGAAVARLVGRPGLVSHRNGALGGHRLSAGMLIGRKRRHLHELRTPNSTGPQGHRTLR